MGGSKAWIFQSRPDRYDLRTELHPGRDEDWLASRYRDLMEPGDIVFFWLSGDDQYKGIYGWGRIMGTPVSSGDETTVPVHNEERFIRPIPVAMIREDPELKELMILRIAIGTNFILQKREAVALAKLSDSSNLLTAVQYLADDDG
jgi:hypothetical protein